MRKYRIVNKRKGKYEWFEVHFRFLFFFWISVKQNHSVLDEREFYEFDDAILYIRTKKLEYEEKRTGVITLDTIYINND